MNAYFVYYSTPECGANRAIIKTNEYVYTVKDLELLAKKLHSIENSASVVGAAFFYEIENKTLPTLELENEKQ